MTATGPTDGSLRRELTLRDAVVLGLGSMIGAGIFAAFGPAAEAAGSWMLLSLVIAGFVAFCNATSSASLAALYPESGGTYVYGRQRLGDLWGYLAGWAFVVGKTASCAAMALTFGTYVAPDHARWPAVAVAVLLTVVNLAGVRKTAQLTMAIVAVVGSVLALVVVAGLGGGTADADRITDTGLDWGVVEGAGILFFAFAGYARIATLGEEVHDPARTIPRAIIGALLAALAIYAVVAVTALLAVGWEVLARSDAPLAAVADAGDLDALTPIVRIGGGVAAAGVLLSLLAGVTRTSFAMARNRHLPTRLASVSDRTGIPDLAQALVGVAVAVVVALVDLREAIGFSSFGVLLYYALANASAVTLGPGERRFPWWLSVAGVGGCLLLAFSLPTASVVIGSSVVGAGAVVWFVTTRIVEPVPVRRD
ncbi:MAG: APC family permease [Acidimicrobiales bacterium]